MKTIRTIIALAMCVAAVSLTSCDQDENDSRDKNVEFAFMGTCEFTSKATAEDSAIVENAFKEAGVPLDGYSLVLTGKDSAAVKILLAEKMDKVVEKVSTLPESVNFKVGANGVAKQYAAAENDKDHPKHVWYSKEIGTPPVKWGMSEWERRFKDFGMGYYSVAEGHEYRFVTDLTDVSYSNIFQIRAEDYSQYESLIGHDLNCCVGGKWIYLKFEHAKSSTKEGKNGRFKWDPENEGKYITDVIGVYGGDAPETMVVNGLTYKRATGDLNKGAGGAYIWLYTTTEVRHYLYHKPLYLNTGGTGFAEGCAVICSQIEFELYKHDYLNCFDGQGRDSEKIMVETYNTEGKPINPEVTILTEFNKDAKGQYIYLVLTYCTKD